MAGRIGIVVAAIALASAPAASAGTYDVNACATPAGKFTNHSWGVSVNGSFVTATCSASDARPAMTVQANANSDFSAGQAAALNFIAPAGTTIAGFRLHHQAYEYNPIKTPGTDQLYTLLKLGGTAFAGGGSYSPPPPTAYAPPGTAYDTRDVISTSASYPALAGYRGDATTLSVIVGCQTASGCSLRSDGAAFVSVFEATVTLNDSTAPVVSRIYPTGLAAGGSLEGDESVTFDANDTAGIRLAELVDVTPGFAPRVVGSEGYRCDYSALSPCAHLGAEQLAPESLDFGTRQVLVRVTDAAGNVGESSPFTVQSDGGPNGSPASTDAKLSVSFRRNHRRRLTLGPGKAANVRGSLKDPSGQAIVDARIRVFDRIRRSGADYREEPTLTTDAKGRFRFKVAAGPSRAIRLEYRARRAQGVPTVRATLSLRVRANVSLAIRPRHVRPGGTITLSGRLKSHPLPRSGKIVDLQAFDAGEWRTFATVRARRLGRYVAHYRFRGGGGHTFVFRARVRREDSYPYALSYSPHVRVHVG